MPQAAAVRGNVTPQLGNSQRALPPGFSVQIVPLRYVGVREMMRFLEPFELCLEKVEPFYVADDCGLPRCMRRLEIGRR